MKDYNEMAESLFRRRDQYIAEKKKKTNLLLKTTSGLSCLCAAILSGLLIIHGSPSGDPDSMMYGMPDASESLTESLQGNISDASGTPAPGFSDSSTPAPGTQSHPDGFVDMYSSHKQEAENREESAGTANETGTAPSGQSGGNGSPDTPVSELSPGSFQTITAAGASAEFFGGSYTDSQGRLCILLTENTSENRSAVCRELGLNESSVTFQDAAYTLSYLTWLQDKISEGMVSKELPFVTESSLREDTNRIHLTVTTEDEAQLAKLKALDTLGGALEISCAADGGSIKNMIEKLPMQGS